MSSAVIYACKSCGCLWARQTSMTINSRCPACHAGGRIEINPSQERHG